MVRTTIAIAVIALGAATVIAQNPIEDAFGLEAREFSDLEMREYTIDDLEARGFEDVVDMDARGFEDEILDARNVHAMPPSPQEPLPATPPADPAAPPPSGTSPPTPSDPHPAAAPVPKEPGGSPAPSLPTGSGGLPVPTPTSGAYPSPSSTVTITETPTPTPCTKKELKHQLRQTKVEKAIACLREHYGRTDLTPLEKLKIKKAKKFLRRVRRRRVKKAKRTVRKCKSALRKAGFTLADCKAGADCEGALEARHLTADKCIAAQKFLKRVKKAKKAVRKAHKKAHKKQLAGKKVKVFHDYAELLPAPTKTIGTDGVTTLTVTPGPTCTASPSSDTKMVKLTARDIVDGEFESVFAREYDFNNLD